MKLFKFVIVIIAIAFIGCERDDICIDPITPDLIIRFYDVDNPDEFKAVSNLSIKLVGFENDSVTTSSDSIAVPLNVAEDFSQYILTINSSNGATLNRDTITLDYTRQEVFVGRSCGFKMVFNEVGITNNTVTNNWIQEISSTNAPLNIENETAAHITILH